MLKDEEQEDIEEVVEDEEQKEEDPEEMLVGEVEELKLAIETLLLPPLLSSSIDQHPPLIYSLLLQSLLGNY